MGVRVAVSCTVVYVLLDVIVSTVLYAHGSNVGMFKKEALNFHILQSVLDLWGTVLLRASLLLGASIGVLWNRRDGPQRVAKLSTPVIFISLILITYALVKLLMLTELEPLSHRPWSLSLICWTCASSLCVVLLWRLLGKESRFSPNGSSSSSSSSGRGGEGCEDTERLLGAAGEEEQEEGRERNTKKEEEEKGRSQEKISSGATLRRLLTYCRKDGRLLSVAFLFLLISAVCEAFIPYYYGKAIDGIVVHHSMEYFAKPVIILVVLVLARMSHLWLRRDVLHVAPPCATEAQNRQNTCRPP